MTESQRVTAEGVLEVESTDDGGRAIICQLDSRERGLFFRFQSWDETGEHRRMRELLGKRVRVTLEAS